jgi:D-galactarolactone cycloisomerase
LKITNIRVERLRWDLEPPFSAAWDPTPRTTLEPKVKILPECRLREKSGRP